MLPLPPLLPCPLGAGWEVVEQVVLPPASGGGFSAGAYQAGADALWLLSDAPRGRISRWRGLGSGGLRGLELLPPLPLAAPQPMDGEGLVLGADDLWVASEGRLDPGRPALLLRYDLTSGELLQQLPLPDAWQPRPQSGLRSNGGPESLTRSGGGEALLMAAERPLLQDPPDRVRLLRWRPDGQGSLLAEELQPLAMPSGDWGLTDLLALPRGLLAIWRRFTPPTTWQARLVLYPSPTDQAAAAPLAPLQQWNLLQLGLPADNWEVLLEGPPLADGRPSLVLASDDNFNPLQASHLARLAPRRTAACPSPGAQP